MLSHYILAQGLMQALLPVTNRREIAGSIRRGVRTPGDIEIVCVPNLVVVPMMDLFNDGITTAEYLSLNEWVHSQPDWKLDVVQRRNGPRWKRLAYAPNPSICCDLFITRQECWGVMFVIRTGPADFSEELMKLALRNSMEVREGQLWRIHRDETRTVVPTPDEPSFFSALGVSYLRPNDRSVESLRRAISKGKTHAKTI